MAIGDSIQRYPLLRLLVPYICGIALADAIYPSWEYLTECSVAVAILCILAMVLLHAFRSTASSMWYGMVASSLFLSLGIASYSLQRDRLTFSWPTEERIYEARVVEPLSRGERSARYMMSVNAMLDTVGWQAVHRHVLVYMPVHAADTLLPGDVVCFRAKVQPPRNFSDELDFDYAHYVTMQGASGTTYLPSHQWKRVKGTNLSLRERMMCLSRQLQTRHMHHTFQSDALSVLSALTLGDRRMLSHEVRAVYADAGVSHVLALSGLHVGIIYILLTYVLRHVSRRRSMRWLSDLVAIVVMWLFALMVGMPSSVVRAVTMYTLFALARWVSSDRSPISTLSLAAFIMLFVHPFYLFDAGFQLSFAAMASILCLEPHLEQLLHRRSLPRVIGYFVSVVCMSLAAQMGTFPLVLHHFGTFPSYFLLTNLLAVPCLSVVLALMLVWWMLVLLGIPLATPLGILLQHAMGFINTCLAHVAQWPGAVLHVSSFPLLSVLFTYLLIASLALFVIKKWSRGLIWSLVALIGLSLSLL